MKKEQMPVNTDKLAVELKKNGFSGLFQYGDRSLVDSIWQDGKNKESLLVIIQGPQYEDYPRLLASEVLYIKDTNHPSIGLEDDLAYLYAKAIEITGSQEGAFLSANLWGFMYHWDKSDVKNYGTLGTHLMQTGKKSIPHLLPLLDNTNGVYYEGSQDATLGNSLNYRVKDIAAYYIGKITGIPVPFHEKWADRDAEIERLKQKLD